MNERSNDPARPATDAMPASRDGGIATGAKHLVNDLAAEAQDKAGKARSVIADSYAAASETAGEVKTALVDRSDAAMKATSGFVKANPWLAVFAAAGVGMAAGTLMRSRRGR